jgi:predicted PurR-regulated permease PerM
MEEPTPNKKILEDIESDIFQQSLVIKAFFLLAVVFTLYFASVLLVPIFLAFLLYFLLIPIVKFLKRNLRIPEAFGSALVILGLLFILGYGFYYLSLQMQEWISKGPEIINTFNQRVSTLAYFLRKPIEFFSSFSQSIKNTLNLSFNPKEPTSLLGIFFSNTWSFLVEFFIMLTVLYFLMASKNFFLTKIVKILLHVKRKKEANVIVDQIEEEIWHYLFIRTMINIGVAIIVSLIFWFFNLPNPILWGILVGILEYIPFIGAAISTIIILFISVISFDNPWTMFLPTITFIIFIALEGNFLFPYLLGRTMTINQVTVVLSIFFFGWIWGFIGSFLAIPLLTTIKIFLNNINEDNFMNELLEE